MTHHQGQAKYLHGPLCSEKMKNYRHHSFCYKKEIQLKKFFKDNGELANRKKKPWYDILTVKRTLAPARFEQHRPVWWHQGQQHEKFYLGFCMGE